MKGKKKLLVICLALFVLSAAYLLYSEIMAEPGSAGGEDYSPSYFDNEAVDYGLVPATENETGDYDLVPVDNGTVDYNLVKIYNGTGEYTLLSFDNATGGGSDPDSVDSSTLAYLVPVDETAREYHSVSLDNGTEEYYLVPVDDTSGILPDQEGAGATEDSVPLSIDSDFGFDQMTALAVLVCSGVLALTLFARLRMEDVMVGVRKDIFDFISENPGEHLASITKNFELSSSSARHHLYVLETTDKIVSHKTGKLRHYYANRNGYSMLARGNSEYKAVISTLKNDTTRDIVKYLFSNQGSNQKNISEALNIHPSTVNWHAKRLGDANIIRSVKQGKDIIYLLNDDLELRKLVNIIEGSAF